MWLHRIVFNIQNRLLGREEQHDTSSDTTLHNHRQRHSAERVHIFQARLQDLDRRLALLR